MATITELRTRVETLVFAGINSTDQELSDSEVSTHIEAGLERYSHDRPDETTEDFDGDGGKYYALTGVSPVLDAFVDGFSSILRVEYPAQLISADIPPQYLENEDYDDDYWAGGIRYLFFPNHAPASTEDVRVRFTAPYSLSAGSVSIPAQDVYAVSCLSAALCCETIAIRYSRSTDSTISADSVDHLSKADQFSRRASELWRKYNEQMGFVQREGSDTSAGSGVPAAYVMTELDTRPSTGRQWLWHRDR